MRGTKTELIEVDALPARRDLDDPCSPRRVHVLGTSRRRPIIGLIPSSHTLSRTTAFLSGGGRSGGFIRDDRFEGIIRPVYCPAPQRASRGYAHPSLRDCRTL
jgi:hypothetical protein